jgi:copper oxidase (laccase) domain-containing protein
MTNDEILQRKIAATRDLMDWRQRQMFWMSPSTKDEWYRILQDKIKAMLEADKLKFNKESEQVSRCVR